MRRNDQEKWHKAVLLATYSAPGLQKEYVSTTLSRFYSCCEESPAQITLSLFPTNVLDPRGSQEWLFGEARMQIYNELSCMVRMPILMPGYPLWCKLKTRVGREGMGEKCVFVSLPYIPQMLGAGLPSCDSQHNWLPVSRGNQNPGAE